MNVPAFINQTEIGIDLTGIHKGKTVYFNDPGEEAYSLLIQRIKNIQNAVIKNILKQILNREPVVEDAKDITLLTNSSNNKQAIFWRSIELGVITHSYEGYNYICTFNPI